MCRVAVIGSRALSSQWFPRVRAVVSALVSRGDVVASGGALGADLFVLRSLVSLAAGGVVFLPGSVSQAPLATQAALRFFRGEVVPGPARPGCSARAFKAACLARNARLASWADAVVGFVAGESRGSWFTLARAAQLGKAVVVFPAEGPAALRSLGKGRWAPCRGRFAGAFRWVPAGQSEPVTRAK